MSTPATAQPVFASEQLNFDEMLLQVGVRLQIITQRQLKPVQYFSNLIGFVKDEYMILRCPIEGGVPIPIADGDALTVRVFSGMRVCSFRCSVMRVFGRPLLYLHVSFPTEVLGTKLRGAARIRVDMPAQLEVAGADVQACRIVDLSVSGAMVESERRLASEEQPIVLQFSLKAPPMAAEVAVAVKAVVRNINVRPGKSGTDVFTYGVRFEQLDTMQFTLLQNLTYEALIEGRGRIV